MARRMRKNFGFGGNMNDARTGVHPAQLAAQSYVKSPMQLAGSALSRRAGRAAQPFADAVSALSGLNQGVNSASYNVLRDSARAYFDNADDSGNLKSFAPVFRAGQKAYRNSMPSIREDARRAYNAVGNAYAPVRDFMGGLVDYGTSAGYAMGRGGRRVGGGMYRGIRDTVRPFLGEAEPADVASPSMIKRGKSVKKNVGKKIRQGLINSVARGRIGAQALAATTGHMIPLLLANPRKAKGIVGQHARIAARDMNVDNFFNREGISNYGRQKALLQEYQNPRSVGDAFMGGVKASKVNMKRVARKLMLPAEIGVGLAFGDAIRRERNASQKNTSMGKRMTKRQAGPKPNKYF